MNELQRALEIRTETQANANTAQRVGSLLFDMLTDRQRRLAYNGTATLSLEAGVAKKIELPWNISIGGDLPNSNIVVDYTSFYKCYAMLTFVGSNNTVYELQLRKNDVNICNCNPQTELLQGRKTNLSTSEYTLFFENDILNLYIVSSKTETIEIHRTKIIFYR